MVDFMQSMSEPLVGVTAVANTIFGIDTAGKVGKTDLANKTDRQISLDCRPSQISIRADGKLLLVGTGEGKVILLSTKTLKKLAGTALEKNHTARLKS